MTIRDHKKGRSVAIDFRTAAPRSASPELYTKQADSDFVSISPPLPHSLACTRLAVSDRAGTFSPHLRPIADCEPGTGYPAACHSVITSLCLD